MEYNVDYFIKKFSKIPESEWCTGTFSEPVKFLGMTVGHRMCAQGHCMPEELRKLMKESDAPQSDNLRKDYPEWQALVDLFGKTDHNRIPGYTAIVIAIINNNDKGYPKIMEHFPQPTAKGRVLSALLHLKGCPTAFDSFKTKPSEMKEVIFIIGAEIVKQVPVSQN